MTPLYEAVHNDRGMAVMGAAFGTMEAAVPPAQSLLARLLSTQVLLPEEWEEVPLGDREALTHVLSADVLLLKLLSLHLLTRFQVDTIRKGSSDDLVLGNYRVLDVLGQGGMGTVYRAEHLLLRRQVALKVMARTTDISPRLIHRFYGERGPSPASSTRTSSPASTPAGTPRAPARRATTS